MRRRYIPIFIDWREPLIILGLGAILAATPAAGQTADRLEAAPDRLEAAADRRAMALAAEANRGTPNPAGLGDCAHFTLYYPDEFIGDERAGIVNYINVTHESQECVATANITYFQAGISKDGVPEPDNPPSKLEFKFCVPYDNDKRMPRTFHRCSDHTNTCPEGCTVDGCCLLVYRYVWTDDVGAAHEFETFDGQRFPTMAAARCRAEEMAAKGTLPALWLPTLPRYGRDSMLLPLSTTPMPHLNGVCK